MRAAGPSCRSRCQALAGQNSLRPVAARTAGTRVIPANSITKIAIATEGPRTLNWPNWARPSAANATMIASAAEAITCEIRAPAAAAACLRSSPARSRSRKRNVMNRK